MDYLRPLSHSEFSALVLEPTWTPDRAAWILAGVDPSSVDERGVQWVRASSRTVYVSTPSGARYRERARQRYAEYCGLQRLIEAALEAGELRQGELPPRVWIQWAKSVPTLNLPAPIREMKVQPIGRKGDHGKERKSMLVIIAALATRTPIAEKRGSLVAWLTRQTGLDRKTVEKYLALADGELNAKKGN